MGRDCLDPKKVVVYQGEKGEYPAAPPFHPGSPYPEYAFKEVGPEPNAVYEGIRSLLSLACLDAENYGSANWNPLHGYIKPGNTVLLKPNLVKEVHPRDPEGWRYTITHGSIIRAVADYVWKALAGKGQVIVADAPQTDSSFAKMTSILGLGELQSFYARQGLDLQVIDLRREEWENEGGVIVKRKPLPGDPHGYIAFDLKDHSEFHGHAGAGRYYGADYDAGQVNAHHSGGRHEYLLAGSAIICDVFINLPKLKTHKKAGITVNLKNLVGVNGDKNWLPHHTCGFPRNGGDQYPNFTIERALESQAAKILHRLTLACPKIGTKLLKGFRNAGKITLGDTEEVIRSGNWFGNDTVWRMCLDLNKLVLYGNPDGTIRPNHPGNSKTYLSFVDAVVAGQGSGPMNTDPFNSQMLLFGSNPVSVDAFCAVLMGFDPEKIPLIRHAFQSRGYALTAGKWQDIYGISNASEWCEKLGNIISKGKVFHFNPHFGWKGHIER